MKECVCIVGGVIAAAAGLMGASLTIPISNGRLALGTWQVGKGSSIHP